jgi:hypothetical protein
MQMLFHGELFVGLHTLYPLLNNVSFCVLMCRGVESF